MYDSQFHRLAAVSKITGLSVDFFRREIRRGCLPASKLNRVVLVSDHDLKSYMSSRRVAQKGVTQ